MTRIASQRAGFGVVLDGAQGAAAWPAADGNLWVARTVHRRGARPLEFESAGSLAAALTEWPVDVTVKCQCWYLPEDAAELREVQERNLLRIAAACRAQGRELLLEIIAGRPGAGRADRAAPVLERLYALGIRPDWWQLQPQADGDAWAHCADVIAQQDEHCRGMLVSAASGKTSALTLASATPAVRGFIAGGSIFDAVAEAWLAGQLTFESATVDLAARFRALLEAWPAERSAN
jgi:5-dehydro-2-deoxygluconokinase